MGFMVMKVEDILLFLAREEEGWERDEMLRVGGGGEEFKRFAIDGSVDDGLFWGGASVEAEAAGLLRFLAEALLF